MDYINDLHELCDTITREIADSNAKIRNSGGKLSAGDVDMLDKLTHTLKSVKAVIAMAEDEGGSYADGMNYGGSYRYPYNGGSYRYSRRRMGYSRSGDLAGKIHELMQDAPNDQIKRDMQRLAEKVEAM